MCCRLEQCARAPSTGLRYVHRPLPSAMHYSPSASLSRPLTHALRPCPCLCCRGVDGWSSGACAACGWGAQQCQPAPRAPALHPPAQQQQQQPPPTADPLGTRGRQHGTVAHAPTAAAAHAHGTAPLPNATTDTAADTDATSRRHAVGTGGGLSSGGGEEKEGDRREGKGRRSSESTKSGHLTNNDRWACAEDWGATGGEGRRRGVLWRQIGPLGGTGRQAGRGGREKAETGQQCVACPASLQVV